MSFFFLCMCWLAFATLMLFGWRWVKEKHVRTFHQALACSEWEYEQLKQEEERLKRELIFLERAERFQADIPDAVSEWTSVSDVETIRKQLLRHVHSIFEVGALHVYSGSRARDAADQWVMEKRQSLFIPDLSENESFTQLETTPEVRSLLSVPILSGSHWSGLLRLTGFVPRLFSRSDMCLLEISVSLAGQAIQYSEERQVLRQVRLRDPITQTDSEPFLAKLLQHELLRISRFHETGGLLIVRSASWASLEKTYGSLALEEVRLALSKQIGVLKSSEERLGVYGEYDFWLWVPDATDEQLKVRLGFFEKALSRMAFAFGEDQSMIEWIPLTWTRVHLPSEATSLSQVFRRVA